MTRIIDGRQLMASKTGTRNKTRTRKRIHNDPFLSAETPSRRNKTVATEVIHATDTYGIQPVSMATAQNQPKASSTHASIVSCRNSHNYSDQENVAVPQAIRNCSRQIWIIGSSIINGAFEHVKCRPLGVDLRQQCHGYSVLWAGHPGLQFSQMAGIVQAMRKAKQSPSFLIIHCGGSDIGKIRCGLLRLCIKQKLSEIISLMPKTCIIWSSILPRLYWKNSRDTRAMEKSRSRINRDIIAFTTQHCGKGIKYPDFQDKTPGLYSDGAQLSYVGYDIFLNTIQDALETFIRNPLINIYPVE